MKRPPGVEIGNRGAIRVLAVSPTQDDHETLRRMLPSPQWDLREALTLTSGTAQLGQRARPPLVLCEGDLRPGSWKEMLDHIQRMTDPPLLIVASRLADERLWAEALCLGAYDVLAKPFEVNEVDRILRSAWSHWRRERKRLHQLNALAAAS